MFHLGEGKEGAWKHLNKVEQERTSSRTGAEQAARVEAKSEEVAGRTAGRGGIAE